MRGGDGPPCSGTPAPSVGAPARFCSDWRQTPRCCAPAVTVVGDIGCGYHAIFARTVLDEAAHVRLIDVSLAADLKRHPKISATEGRLPEALAAIPSESLDVVLCVSVLEHLWEPIRTLLELRRMLAPGGVCLLNVPSWRGKRVLAASALPPGPNPHAEKEQPQHR